MCTVLLPPGDNQIAVNKCIIFPPKFLEVFMFLILAYILNAARISGFSNYITLKRKFRVERKLPLHMSGRKAGGVDV